MDRADANQRQTENLVKRAQVRCRVDPSSQENCYLAKANPFPLQMSPPPKVVKLLNRDILVCPAAAEEQFESTFALFEKTNDHGRV